MAIYHVSGKIISRSGGRSAVAAAAYRSAEELFDERIGISHDYSNKVSDVLYKEILKPENAPEWVMDRGKLWNEVELVEKRKDAQLAREFVVSLPKELSLEQNIELGKEFVKNEFVSLGMIADVCIHDGKHLGESQPHMHVMLTLREIDEEGFGKKVREWNSKELLLHWRESWANLANEHLARAGIDVRIDHRTLEAQGIDLEPQNKIGPQDGRERYYENVKEHQEVARRNGEKLYDNPEIALKALTQQQSTFTHHDIAKIVNRHTVDEEQFSRVYGKVKSCPELVKLGSDERGRERYTTKDMLTIERSLSVMAKYQAEEELHHVSERTKEKILEKYDLSLEQQEAFKHITDAKGLACVVGFAGTGKSYMLKAAREAWEKEGYSTLGMTLSGIAAENLEESSGIRSYTVASRLMSWGNNNNKLNSRDVVVVDEAGMLGSRDMSKVMTEVRDAGAKLVLIGDPEQLQPIQAGAAFRMIAEQSDYIQINDIRRQEIRWQREATFCLATGQTAKALEMYQKQGDVQSFKTREEAMLAMVAGWKQELMWDRGKSQIMMAYTRKDVARLNMEARQVMESQGLLGKSCTVETAKGERGFAEGERIYFLRNDKHLGVKNGTLGIIEDMDNDKLSVRLDKAEKTVSFSTKDYNHLEYGYAATVYKAQGITVDRAHVLASPNYNRHATYVAMSRHKEEVKLYWAQEDFSSFDSLKNRMGKAQQKDVSLDYIDVATKFAINRSIEIDFASITELFKEPIKQHEVSKLTAIEARLESRYNERIFNRDIENLKERFNKRISFDLEHGDQGKYLGITKIGNERYGVIEQKSEIKLVQAKLCEDLDKGLSVQIKTSLEGLDKAKKIEIKPITQEIAKTRDFSMEM